MAVVEIAELRGFVSRGVRVDKTRVFWGLEGLMGV